MSVLNDNTQRRACASEAEQFQAAWNKADCAVMEAHCLAQSIAEVSSMLVEHDPPKGAWLVGYAAVKIEELLDQIESCLSSLSDLQRLKSSNLATPSA
jgi:hypothetical protein